MAATGEDAFSLMNFRWTKQAANRPHLRNAVTLLILTAMLSGAWAAAPASSRGGSGTHTAVPGTLPLAESERAYIAEIEHHGLVLSRKGFPAIAAAIRKQDVAAFKHFLAASFRGQTLDLARGQSPDNSPVKIRRVTSETASSTAPADADAFVKYLLQFRSQFAKEAKVELALMSLSPLKRENTSGAWKGSCALRVAGARVAGGLEELLLVMEFDLGFVPDVDVIEKERGWVQSLRLVEAQEAIAARELMAEVAREQGLDRSLFQDNWDMPHDNRAVVTGGVYLGDIDNDGRDDVLVTDLKGTFLFRAMEDGRFAEVTARAGLPRNLRGVANAAFGDFDNDGFVDLLLDTRVFRNLGGAQFSEVTWRPGFLFGPALGLVVGDYDKDGRLDIYVPRYHGGKLDRYGSNSWIDGSGGPGNQLWRNLGDWKFEEVAQKANARAGRRSCFSSAWLDANNDNWPDIYAINEFGGGALLLNQGNGTFKELPLLEGDPGDFGSMGLAVGDYDNDGNIDVYTANMYSKAGRRIFENLGPGTYPEPIWTKIKRFVTGSELYQNLGGLKFARVGAAMRVRTVGWAYGTAFVDLDNDGFLDLYGTAGFVSVNKAEPDG
jgi:hypothetical protein